MDGSKSVTLAAAQCHAAGLAKRIGQDANASRKQQNETRIALVIEFLDGIAQSAQALADSIDETGADGLRVRENVDGKPPENVLTLAQTEPVVAALRTSLDSYGDVEKRKLDASDLDAIDSYILSLKKIGEAILGSIRRKDSSP